MADQTKKTTDDQTKQADQTDSMKDLPETDVNKGHAEKVRGGAAKKRGFGD